MTRGIINSYDQVVARGGGPIISRHNLGIRETNYYGWEVTYFTKNGGNVVLDKDAHWKLRLRGAIWFQPRDEPKRKHDPNTLADAKAWCEKRFGVKDWKRNRFGDYVPADCPPIQETPP